jgi:aconitate hydratase
MPSEFICCGEKLHFVDIGAIAAASGKDIAAFPYVVRVLLENLCRHRIWSGGESVSDGEVDAVLNWSERAGADLPLHVARVILPDSSGLPVLQDLAALRDAVARQGGDASAVDTRIPVDLIVDHSLQVDHWGSPMALEQNLRQEFERNAERYQFLKWAQQAYRGLRVYPPGTGIIHQVNLEHLARVVVETAHEEKTWALPDFVIGGDSHTPMVNALGVLGWGVGGIDAEAAMLGHAYTFPLPQVVGVKLTGAIRPPALTTDAALQITQTLRREGVTGFMVEFFGPAVAQLPIPERATIANMAPEYGATCGYFPVDEATIAYLRETGRSERQVELVDTYCRRNHLFRSAATSTPAYSRIIEIDLSQAVPSLAGPGRPQDRMALADIPADFRSRLDRPLANGGFGETLDARIDSTNKDIRNGSVVVAAITSCTNTSNPAVMLAAGLVALKAVQLGVAPPAWVKTSMAPGSRAVTAYLERSGLLSPLEALGFHVIGYGCTTCGGKSGPLNSEAAHEIEARKLVTVAVLSGNRNFEGRIHKLVRANYIGSPPLVVIYALAGRIDIDLSSEPVAVGHGGRPVYLRDLWPSPEEIARVLPFASDRALYEKTYDQAGVDTAMWRDMAAPAGVCFPWDRDSTYLVEPPFFNEDPRGGDAMTRLSAGLASARVLAAFDDSLTTDHISPGGEIPVDTPAGQYLSARGITPRNFNSYVARRCNYHVMTRATFANIRIKNALVPGVEGGVTRHFPSGARMTIFDAAAAYRNEGISSLILAGKDYGTGSSRDWAAKGSALLGVKAVLAESFERIHRANLVGMGVLPLAFAAGQGWRALGLTGSESFHLEGIDAGVRHGEAIEVTATREDGSEIRFPVYAQVLTHAEKQLMIEGGIPASILRRFLSA